jgi:hypothetical protein
MTIDPHAPKRVQLRRTKGWRKPEGCIVVARPSKWGNPHTVSKLPGEKYLQHQARVQLAVDRYRNDLMKHQDDLLAGILAPLRGHDLACWCPLDQPCHADVLLELANA